MQDLRGFLEQLNVLAKGSSLLLLFRRWDRRREGRLDAEALQDMVTPINSIYENYLRMKRPQFGVGGQPGLSGEVRGLLRGLFEESMA